MLIVLSNLGQFFHHPGNVSFLIYKAGNSCPYSVVVRITLVIFNQGQLSS